MQEQTKRRLKRSWKKFVDFFPFMFWEISARMEESRERRQKRFKEFKKIFTHMPDVRAAKKEVARERRRRVKRRIKDFFPYLFAVGAAKREEARIKSHNASVKFRRNAKDLPAFLLVSFVAKMEEFGGKLKQFFKKVKDFFPNLLYQRSIRNQAKGEMRQRRRRAFKRRVRNFFPNMAYQFSRVKKRISVSMKRFWRLFKPVSGYTFLRFFSILFISTIVSAPLTALNIYGIWVVSPNRLLFSTLIAAFLALVIDFLWMRRDYIRFADKRTYRVVNFVSHGAFAAVNITASCFFSKTELYAYMFGIMKLLRIAPPYMPPFFSAIIMNAVLLIMINAATTGIKWLR